MNKNLMIGLGVLAVAGIAYYMYNKPKATEKKSEARGLSFDPDEIQLSAGERRLPKGMKKCACGACSKSMLCKDCCEGGGVAI